VSGPLQPLLSIQQVAELLGCSTRSVRRRIDQGELPAFVDGRLVRVRASDLDRYIEQRTRPLRLSSAPAPRRRESGQPPAPARSLFDLADPLDHGGEPI
jgi:excisionase family DNA binding protein